MHKSFPSLSRKLLLCAGSLVPMTCLLTNTLASDLDMAHPPHYPMPYYKKAFYLYDTAALRRGYQVYKEVCSSCHPVKFICYRHLVGVIFTEKQAKQEAASAMIEDGPDEEGDLFLRPGNLQDVLPPPYKNDMSAKSANNGSLPPDLSIIIGQREGAGDYLFSLLTGYGHEIPPGVNLEKGQHFNPFFEGGIISMPPPLADGAVDYPDGTPATVTQMSADITEFFTWAWWRYMQDQRLMWGFQCFWFLLTVPAWIYLKKWVWADLQSQRITYKARYLMNQHM